jgi:hypothetical protein
MVIEVELQHHWDSIAQQTTEMAPQSGYSILLAWRVEPPAIDGGVPREVARAIARTLTNLGEVAFRWSGAPAWPQGDARIIPAPYRHLIQRAADWLNASWPAELVVTRSAAAAAQLFEHDWEMQGQAALVLDPCGGEAQSALAALRTRRDWQSFELISPAIALITPIVDGDGALLTTRLPEVTEDIVGHLASAFADVGIALRNPHRVDSL